jgi:IclR family transcriptional regulator, acetate operon repressor
MIRSGNNSNAAAGQDTPPIQSLDRGLIILDMVAKANGPVPLSELTAALGIDRSSAFRLATTLKRRGFLTYSPGRRDYILGPILWYLSQSYDWATMLIRISGNRLKLLANQTGESAHLAVRRGKHALFIGHAGSSHVISVSSRTGEKVPLYCTAHGKALLADMELPELQSLFGRFALRKYDGEFQEGIRCLAAPIRAESGIVVGSIGISAPTERFPEQRYPVTGAQVQAIAEEISANLSHQSVQGNGSVRPISAAFL